MGTEGLLRGCPSGHLRLAVLCCIALAMAISGPIPQGEAAPARKAKADVKAVQPEVRIPVDGLGYTAPGPLPRLDYEAMVGMYFIDETHLLFTFNTSGLLQRDNKCAIADSQRMVRAVVLDILSGKVEKQAEWELYDFKDYLWSLGGGKFLLRRCSQLDLVDASLEPQPLIDAAGSIQAIEFSPDRSVVMLEEDSEETAKQPAPAKNPVFGPGGRPAKKVDLQFIQLQPLQVITRAHLSTPGAVPITDQGILEALAGSNGSWTVDLQPFRGAERKFATIRSACVPTLTPVANSIIVAGVCSGDGRSFAGYDLTGLLLWRVPVDDDRHYQRFLFTRNGAHFAIESLHANRPLAALDPLDDKVIDAQIIDIYDTTTGVRIGSLRTTPVFTAGQNADFSPDGTRIAVLHDGAIEIYSLNELGKNLQ